MKVTIIKKNKLIDFVLPMQVHGNYWIKDEDRNLKERNLINVVDNNNKWEIISNYEASIYDNGEYKKTAILEEGKFYTLKIEKEEDAYIYASSVYTDKYIQLMIKRDAEFTIGSKETCQIQYISNMVDLEHTKIVYKQGVWYAMNVSNKGTYVNKEAIATRQLKNGDVIFIMGLKIIVVKNNLIVNNIDKIKVDGNLFGQSSYPLQNIKEFDTEQEEEVEAYKDGDYFFKAPRFRNNPDRISLQIDAPPPKQEEDKTPLLLSIGSMLTMGVTSGVSAFTAINSVVANGRPLKEALPSIIMSVAMLVTMFLWPLLNRRYRKKQFKKYEKLRVEKYTQYIEDKRNFVRDVIKIQTDALNESFPDSDELIKIIMFKKTNLWERERDQDDFLKLRVGRGTVPVNMDINYPQEHFSLQVDDLKDITNRLVNDSKLLENVPIVVSFTDKYISALVGDLNVISNVCLSLILQIITYHSYDDVKLVIFTNEQNAKYWEQFKVLPHLFDNEKTIRYFAKNVDDMQQISSNLENIFQARVYKDGEDKKAIPYTSVKPYYFIITDDFKNARDIEIIKDVLSQEINSGFSLLILNDRLTNLPNECMNFISIGNNSKGVIFEDELVTNKQKKFNVDYNPNLNLSECSIKLANIPIDTIKDDVNFPNSISFLEMYNVGKVEQLNSYTRWQNNTPINSIQAPLGIDKQGNILKLDLHEKFHGPHGLIAGMTGSGKSELIITYILSLAVNYHPHDVSFIIIDYKGGGVARAFENRETGKKLPHIAGTITNLDTAEMNRALISIDSELRRRQRVFNKARNISGESTIDIYKYQKLYKNGVVDEPISHLFIICDEFAELKAQQPDFMDQLISTARIGRSLGVHLILATQKPSGVVNDQIWSNSRFRICLKVQEKADSMDMIKTPEAATIKNVGRFYLQVGYNEFFAYGLSAYCGASYIPTDKPKRKVDTTLNFIDDVGYITKSIDDEKEQKMASCGEQLSNIMDYLIEVANEENIKVRQLWLEKIPALIYVEDLVKKYNYKSEVCEINPVIGEYDDPANQLQNILTVNLNHGGNLIVYGSTGSGKNTLLNSLIYSTITNHDSNEVNFYILDFGSEILRIYEKAPQVGDVIFINETEKVNNLFKTINQKMADRKKLFAKYNGDFNYYNKKSDKKEPLIVVMINNFEAFYETYQDYDEEFQQFTREGLKYGIVFIITATATSTIRFKLRQNFKQEICLQLNDESDYVTIFPEARKKYPSKLYGRGLVKIDAVHEFQTAYPYDPEKLSEHIMQLCEELSSKAECHADAIKVLPEIVTESTLLPKLGNLNKVPIGINKNTLDIMTWDFDNNIATIISAIEFQNMEYFLKPFILELSKVKDTTVVVFDAVDYSKDIKNTDNLFIYKKDFGKVIESLNGTLLRQKDLLVKNNYNRDSIASVKPLVCVILGLDSLMFKFSPDAKNEFISLMERASLLKTIKFIFADTIDIFKKIEYDNWYKTIAKNNQGIWLGNGVSEQYAIKITRLSRELQAEIPIGFGYIIKRGVPVLTKFLTSETGYEEESDE